MSVNDFPHELILIMYGFLDKSSQLPFIFTCRKFKVPFQKLNMKYTRQCAIDGHLSLLKWARGMNYSWNGDVCEIAAKGNLPILKWAYCNKCPFNNIALQNVCNNATIHGNLDVLKWVKETICPWEYATLRNKCGGRMEPEVKKFVKRFKYPWTADLCESAAHFGHLEVLKWLRSIECPWNVETFISAGCKGHLEVLDWAYANGAPFDDKAFKLAAYNGHVNILKWGYNRFLRFGHNREIFTSGAKGGQLEVLKLLQGWRCPFNKDEAYEAAVMNNHPEVADWISQLD